MLAFRHKGFTAETDFDWLKLRWIGRVIDTGEELGFSGATVDEAEKEFQKTVDAYVAANGGLGKAA